VNDRIIELLYRNLQEVFGEGDAVRRRAAIEDFYTEDCVLYVARPGWTSAEQPPEPRLSQSGLFLLPPRRFPPPWSAEELLF